MIIHTGNVKKLLIDGLINYLPLAVWECPSPVVGSWEAIA